MELVYLWVKEYKNIHKQGFNFSPRFECKFHDEYEKYVDDNGDEKERLKDDCKLEIKPKEHIENFFGENINVTAIVGKNGSGKSSVIKLILMAIYYHKFRYLSKDDKFSSPETFDRVAYKNKNYIENEFENKLFLIVNHNNELKKISIGLNSVLLRDIPDIGNIDFFSIYYNYMLDTLNDGTTLDYWISNSYHRVNEYSSSILLEPQKFDGNDEKIDIELLEYITSQKLATLYKLKLHNNFIEKYFNPNKIKFSINMSKLKTKFKLLGTLTHGNPLIQHDGTFRHNGKVFNNFTTNEINNRFNNFFEEKSVDDINNLYIGLKLLEHNHLMKRDEYIALRKSFINSFDTDRIFESFFNQLDKYNINNPTFLKDDITGFEKQKLINAFNFRDKIVENDNYKIQFEQYLDNIVQIDMVEDIIIYMPQWVDVDYFENEKSYKSLSSGEKLFINFFMSLIYQINNLKDTAYRYINIFLDEVELGFHPEWQKKYLSALLLSTKKLGIQVNFIFLSHSPFILSDIPKQNIIFLDKDENGNCKVVDGLKEKKQTFGANIHTLLSDSFFMDDGLVGEFSKAKIDKAIKLLNQDSLDEKELKYCEQIISIIGEPIVKNQLQRMLDSKRLKKVDEIDALKQSMKAMQKRLDELEK